MSMNSKEDYKKISRRISLFFVLLVMSVLAVPVAVEFDLDSMASLEGALIFSVDEQMIYFIEVFMFFLTGICILLALKFFDRLRLRRVAKAKDTEKASVYFGVYTIRLAILAVPMLSGVIFYYSLLENWGLYYALAAFVASFFCLPSAEGVEIELTELKNS